MIIFRPATAADQKRIVAIIRAARINPMNLKWEHFLLAVDDASGEIVGTGQIKPHDDSSRELASIAVSPAYQHQGIARQIIERLLETHGRAVLYLTCVSAMGPFYEPFGFRAIGREEMTPYFKRLTRVAQAVGFLQNETLLVMKRNG